MPVCNSSYCKTNTYVYSVSVESRSSGTTHTFKKEDHLNICQELLPYSISAFIFLYAHRKHTNAEQRNQKKHYRG